MGEGLFNPDGKITREQIVTILYRYAKYADMDTSKSVEIDELFKDAAKVSDYAREAMAWAVAEGIIQGDNLAKVNPQGNATRAEVATMMTRFHKLQLVQPEEDVIPDDSILPDDGEELLPDEGTENP